MGHKIGLALHVCIWFLVSTIVFTSLSNQSIEGMDYLTLYRNAYYYKDSWCLIAKSMLYSLPVFLFFIVGVKMEGRKLFGDARLATYSDIKKAGLFEKIGIVCGRFKGELMMFGSSLHVLLSAPTGGGKGVSIVIPTLLRWTGSVVCVDMKQENFSMTSLFRKLCGHEVYFLNFLAADYMTHRWNPLFYVSKDPNFRIDDIQKIASMLFQAQAKNTDIIWIESPKNLFLGICLYILDEGGKLTLGEVLRISLTGGDPRDFFIEEIKTGKLSKECMLALNTYCSIAADNTRSGILAGFRAALSLWMNPICDAATSDNDFDLRDLRKKKISIYLGVTPDNLDRLAPVISLFFQQVIDLNTRVLPAHDKSLKHQCLLLMDEFAALGKMQSLSKGIAYIRGYGLRLMCVIQSPAQLVDIYGQAAADNFKENHAMTIVFPPKASDVKTAEDISKWLGFQTVKGKSTSGSMSPFSKNGMSQTKSDQKRALLLPQEISGLKEGKQLVVLEKTPPILADMAYFYNDKECVARLKKTSAMLAKISGLPTQKDYEKAMVSGELSAPVPKISINQLGDIDMKIKDLFDDLPIPAPGDIDEALLNARAEAIYKGVRHG